MLLLIGALLVPVVGLKIAGFYGCVAAHWCIGIITSMNISFLSIVLFALWRWDFMFSIRICSFVVASSSLSLFLVDVEGRDVPE